MEAFESEIICASLSKEERETLLAKKIEDIRRKNKELEKRHAEIEADKRQAVGSKASVQLPTAATIRRAPSGDDQPEAPAAVEVDKRSERTRSPGAGEDAPGRSGRTPTRRARGPSGKGKAAAAAAGAAGRRSSRDASLLKYPLKKPGFGWRSSRESLVGGRRRTGPPKKAGGRACAHPAADGEASGQPELPQQRPLSGADAEGDVEAAAALGKVASASVTYASRGVDGARHVGRHPAASCPAKPANGKAVDSSTPRVHHRRGGSGDAAWARATAVAAPDLAVGAAAADRFPTSAESPAAVGRGGAQPTGCGGLGASNGAAPDCPPVILREAAGQGGADRARNSVMANRPQRKSYDETRKRNAAAYEEEQQQQRRSSANVDQSTQKGSANAGGSAQARGFLADQSRDAAADFTKTNGEHRTPYMRHRRNFGGGSAGNADLSRAKDKFQAAGEVQAAVVPAGPPTRLDLEMRMTGRERHAYSTWREERERVDEERLGRARNSAGGWRREWDADKSESAAAAARQCWPAARSPLSPTAPTWPYSNSANTSPADGVLQQQQQQQQQQLQQQQQQQLPSPSEPYGWAAPGRHVAPPPSAGAVRRTVGSGRFVSQGDRRKTVSGTAGVDDSAGGIVAPPEEAEMAPPAGASRRRRLAAGDSSKGRPTSWTDGESRWAARRVPPASAPPREGCGGSLGRRWPSRGGWRMQRRGKGYGSTSSLHRPASRASVAEDIVVIHIEIEDDDDISDIAVAASGERVVATELGGDSSTAVGESSIDRGRAAALSACARPQQSGKRSPGATAGGGNVAPAAAGARQGRSDEDGQPPPAERSGRWRRGGGKQTGAGRSRRAAAAVDSSAGIAAGEQSFEARSNSESAKEDEWEDVAEADAGAGGGGGEGEPSATADRGRKKRAHRETDESRDRPTAPREAVQDWAADEAVNVHEAAANASPAAAAE